MTKATLGLLVLGSLASCSPKVYQPLDWQAKLVIADGKMEEWPNPLRFYDDKSKINYTVTNDRKNLYLCMKVVNPIMQGKIMQAGVDFMVDTLGKDRYPISFSYPVAKGMMMPLPTPSTAGGDTLMRGRQGRGQHGHRPLGLPSVAEVVGFKPNVEGVIRLGNTVSGISAAVDVDKVGVMYYEAVIPFSTFYKDSLAVSDSSKVFSFRIQVNALPEGREGGMPTEGAMPREGGMHRGGGRPSGGMSGGDGMARGGMNGGGSGRGARMEGEVPGGRSPRGGVDMSSINRIDLTMKLSVK
jgi:hypothetical protein